jgi:ubiquinone/menaquinone biosynthesis C-methylase UbiE
MDSEERAARLRSRAAWDGMAAGWEAERDAIWEDSRTIGEWLVNKLDPRPGDTVLELAAGVGDTGLVAARRVGPDGRVLITDFAPAMVDSARRRAAELGIVNAEFRVLDAENIDLATGSVDGVLCRWGYMLMIDPARALAETRRILRPGGRLAFSVWAAPEQNPWASLVSRLLVAQGHMAPPAPGAPGIFALANEERVRSLVTNSGFSDPVIEEVPSHRRFVSFDAYWRYLTEMAGAISPLLRNLSPEAQHAIRARLQEAITPFAHDGGYEFPRLCLNVVAS